MAIKRAQLDELKEKVSHAARPLVFYDDDADGLSSFLLIRKFNPEARGIRAARGPTLSVSFQRYLQEHQPDLILILDKPRVEEEFLSRLKTPIIWLDHHKSDQEPEKWRYSHLSYMNPLLNNARDSRPTSYWVYKAIGGPKWLACAGILSDWSMALEPDAKVKELMGGKKTIMQILFDSKMGDLIQALNFSLKGSSSSITKNVSSWTRVEQPEDVLQSKTSAGRFIVRNINTLKKQYLTQLEFALSKRTVKGLHLTQYDNLANSFVKDVANELLYRKKAKVIIVARHEGARVNFSMRSLKKDVKTLLTKSLIGIEGYGGGHRLATGGSIDKRDWKEFLDKIRANI